MQKIKDKLSDILIYVILILLIVSAYIAYGNPWPAIKLLLKADPIAWKAIFILIGWIIFGLAAAYVIDLLYQWLFPEEKEE